MILLTGASGFVGRALREALGAGDTLAVDRPGATREGDLACDLTTTDAVPALEAAVRARGAAPPTCLVHLAGITPWSNAPDYGLDLAMADTVARLCAALGVPRLLFLSGWVVYDPSTPAPYTEESPVGPRTPYGASKLAVERRLANIGGRTRVVHLRASSVYGAGQASAGLIPNLVSAALRGGPLVLHGRTTRRDYLHIADLVNAVVRLSSREPDAPVTTINLGSGRSFSVAEAAEAVRRACRDGGGADVSVEYAPDAIEGEPRDNRLSIERARGLGLLDQQVSFDEGIRDYVRWRRREGLL